MVERRREEIDVEDTEITHYLSEDNRGQHPLRGKTLASGEKVRSEILLARDMRCKRKIPSRFAPRPETRGQIVES